MVDQANVIIGELKQSVASYETRCKAGQVQLDEAAAAAGELVAENENLQRQRGELERQNAEMGQQVVDQGGKIKQLSETVGILQNLKSGAEKELGKIEKDNSFLRDHLNAMTIEKARLEGHLERVHAFDPVTDQQRFRERPLMTEDYVSGRAMTPYDQGPWYRRAG